MTSAARDWTCSAGIFYSKINYLSCSHFRKDVFPSLLSIIIILFSARNYRLFDIFLSLIHLSVLEEAFTGPLIFFSFAFSDVSYACALSIRSPEEKCHAS